MLKQLLQKHWKDVLSFIAIVIVVWSGYTYIKGWIDFREAQLVNIRIISTYMQNDNPKLLQQILNPQAQQPTQPKQQAPVQTPAPHQPIEPGQEAIK